MSHISLVRTLIGVDCRLEQCHTPYTYIIDTIWKLCGIKTLGKIWNSWKSFQNKKMSPFPKGIGLTLRIYINSITVSYVTLSIGEGSKSYWIYYVIVILLNQKITWRKLKIWLHVNMMGNRFLAWISKMTSFDSEILFSMYTQLRYYSIQIKISRSEGCRRLYRSIIYARVWSVPFIRVVVSRIMDGYTVSWRICTCSRRVIYSWR